jgi:hypothetical protein
MRHIHGMQHIPVLIYDSSSAATPWSAHPRRLIAHQLIKVISRADHLIVSYSDYDAWRVSEEPVTVAEVIATLTRNVENSKKITGAILAEVHRAVAAGALGQGEEGGMRYSVMTKPEAWPEEDRKKLAFILPYIFDKQI